MPEPKEILIFYEGDDDKAFLEKLLDAGHLTSHCRTAGRSKEHHPGKDGLVRQLLAFIRPMTGVGGDAVVLVDIDELTFDQRFIWFRDQIARDLSGSFPQVNVEEGPRLNERVRLLHLVAGDMRGRVALIPAGIPDDPRLTQHYKVDRFAIDDWILRLVDHERVFGAVSELKPIPFAIAMKKLSEVADLFRNNGIEVRRSKTFIQILRALAALAPSTATIIGRLVQKAAETLPVEEFRAILYPLLDDFDVALRALSDDG
jgi:hypothetical protein